MATRARCRNGSRNKRRPMPPTPRPEQDLEQPFARMKLKAPVNIREFLKNRQAEFEVDTTSSRNPLDEINGDDNGDSYWLDPNEVDVGFEKDDCSESGSEDSSDDALQEISVIHEQPGVTKTPLPYFFNIAKMKEEEKSRRENEAKKQKKQKQNQPYFKFNLKLATEMMPITDDGGLLKLVRHPGNGVKPSCGSTVWVKYIVFEASDSTRKYEDAIDSSHEKTPISFTLFKRDVLPALEYGVNTMELYEKADFLASPAYAYGPLGMPGIVKPNMNCMFTVELVKFLDTSLSTTVLGMEGEEQNQIGFEQVMEAANEFKLAGNLRYQEQNLNRALQNYRNGILLLERHMTLDKDEEKGRDDLLFIFYNNMAKIYLDKEDGQRALTLCTKADQLPPGTNGNRAKLTFRQAQAYLFLEKLEKARDACRLSMKYEPGNTYVIEMYEKVSDTYLIMNLPLKIHHAGEFLVTYKEVSWNKICGF